MAELTLSLFRAVGKHDFASLESYMLNKGDAAKNVSGRQEMIENVLNRYLK